jgi:7-cyano-7-deazaguanine synthase
MKVLNLTSGGLDSAATASFLKAQGAQVRGLFVDFGQPAAAQEIVHAKKVAEFLQMPLSIMNVSPNRRYENGEIIGRNLFLIACALMETQDECMISIGVHSGSPYYDCSIEFLESTQRIVAESSDGKVRVLAPFAQWNKSEILTYTINQGIPPELTYSCELGGSVVCGECLSCRDRMALGVSGA